MIPTHKPPYQGDPHINKTKFRISAAELFTVRFNNNASNSFTTSNKVFIEKKILRMLTVSISSSLLEVEVHVKVIFEKPKLRRKQLDPIPTSDGRNQVFFVIVK